MIHNTGPYGPNEAPINMGTPVNMTPLNVPMIPHNLNNLGKIPQQQPHPSSGGYNLPNFSPYAHHSLNMGPQMPPFPNYHSNVFHNTFLNQSSRSTIDTGWQNGMLPMNLNMQRDQAVHALNFQNFDKRTSNEYKNTEMYPKVPLNIPQFPNKTHQKQVQSVTDPLSFDVDQQEPKNSNTKEIMEQNLDLSTKHPDILEQDSSRRKTLENTIRLIENMLVNTTKNREMEMQKESERKTQETETNEISKEPEEAQNVINESASDHEVSESEEDVKPNINLLNNETKICVKLEPMDILEMEADSMFLRDRNGVSREEIGDSKIVDNEISVTEATEAIKNGSKSEAYYECPHCRLLLKHPKRFLIHTKWHFFGLTRSKRIEMARVKSERRIQLREARMADKAMTSNDVTNEDIQSGKAFPCKDCDKIFMSKSSLKNHRGRLHPTRVRECKICKKSILGWMALRAHIASHTGDSGYQCADCPKKFKYAHSLAKHRDTHLEKTHACDQCPKMFGSQALLKMHMKCHERALRGATFRCTYCGKGFFEAWNLQVHERTHRNERPFLCEICNTSFGTNSSLKRHVKVSHSASKPHECSTCHRCFSTASIRDRHERRLHGNPEDFKFLCKQCPCRYLTSKDLQKHVYKVHPKCKRKKKAESDSE